jgi:hypothetical protein
LLIEIEGFLWDASSHRRRSALARRRLPFLRVGFVFPAALTPIRACDRSRSSNLINAISVEEELGRTQSKPTHAKAFGAG